MSVSEIIKKSIYFGLGAAAFSAEKLKTLADDMVARGEMSSEEAKRFVDDMTHKAEEEKGTIQEWINERVAKMLQQAGAAQAERVERLEERVAALEMRVAELGGEADVVVETPAPPVIPD